MVGMYFYYHRFAVVFLEVAAVYWLLALTVPSVYGNRCSAKDAPACIDDTYQIGLIYIDLCTYCFLFLFINIVHCVIDSGNCVVGSSILFGILGLVRDVPIHS